MNDDQLVACVPRPLLCVIVLLCAGLGVLSKSWGVVGVYVVLHGLAAYLTYRDERWLHIFVEALRFRYRLLRLHYRPQAWRRRTRLAWAVTVGSIMLIYAMSFWLLG